MIPVAVILIGRNEGARLRRSLASVAGQVEKLVYVDSGSTDGSVAAARAAGALVVELDRKTPFTAARARNAGFSALGWDGTPEFVQFIDGDCAVEPGWIAAAHDAIRANPELGIVTGWRSEIDRGRSVFNAICDFEWHRPPGEILACGGDMMVRATAFRAVGGFDPTVIAAEDDEFCARIRKSGLKILRLPLPMTRHDANMTRFSEWWRRAVRSGHGFAQVGALHPDHFRAERRRVWLYGAALPAIALLGAAVTLWLPLLVAAAYAVSWHRTAQGLTREGLPAPEARHHAAYITLSKLPNLLGMLTYHWRRWRGAAMQIIEYK